MSATKIRENFISKNADAFFSGLYGISSFATQYFKEVFIPPFEFRETIKQCYNVGNKTLSLVSITAFIIGMVFTVHSRPALSEFGATSWLPSLTGAAIMRALAPLITSLICAGKTASQLGAELGSMKVTEQIDAMEVSAINPFKFLVVTRVTATTAMMPILVFYSAIIGLLGSFMDVYMTDQTNMYVFLQQAFSKVDYMEILSAFVRSLVFGFTIGIVGCYRGFTTTKGTEGVGRAANMSVVISMFVIFLEESVIVRFFNAFYST